MASLESKMYSAEGSRQSSWGQENEWLHALICLFQAMICLM